MLHVNNEHYTLSTLSLVNIIELAPLAQCCLSGKINLGISNRIKDEPNQTVLHTSV